MGKSQIQRKESQSADGRGGIGRQMEQTVMIDDNLLPSPQELAAYKEVNPDIVEFLMEASKKEQEYRHGINRRKIEVLDRNEKHETRINITGMVLAFLVIVLLIALSAYALYLDRPWFAGFSGIGAIAAVLTIFVNNGTRK